MKPSLAIEYHPENGDCPWAIVTTRGPSIWLAHQNVADAAKKLKDPTFVRLFEAFLADHEFLAEAADRVVVEADPGEGGLAVAKILYPGAVIVQRARPAQ